VVLSLVNDFLVVLIDGGSSLNIIFTETLKNIDFDFTKMIACDEPLYRVVPGKAAYPIGRVCVLVTFSKEDNLHTEYLMFEVADFRSSYHAILGRPMLAKFMAIPHHTYLVTKMPALNGILSFYDNLIVSFKCESDTIDPTATLACRVAATVMVAQSAKIDQTTLQVPEQKRTSTALAASVVWTSLGPLPRWVPGPTTRWAPGTTRLALHCT
jgi:hypothetical protein